MGTTSDDSVKQKLFRIMRQDYRNNMPELTKEIKGGRR